MKNVGVYIVNDLFSLSYSLEISEFLQFGSTRLALISQPMQLNPFQLAGSLGGFTLKTGDVYFVPSRCEVSAPLDRMVAIDVREIEDSHA